MNDSLTGRLARKLKEQTLKMSGPGLVERLMASRPPSNEFGLDPFGFSIDYALAAVAPFLWLYRKYFRVDAQGMQHVPKGRALLVSNHSGQLPFDAAMIGVSMLVEADPPRIVRTMVEKWVPTLPYVSVLYTRLGQVVGTPENARRLLDAGEALLVFPEGVRGLNKVWRDRYRLMELGLGFVRLALETDTPIVPLAVVGAEEQAPALFDLKPVARLLGMPALPITPTLLPFPLPSRYFLRFGEPMLLTGNANDEDAELERKVKLVRAAIQSLMGRALKERGGRIFF